MSMTNKSSPPTRDLPDEIEAALSAYATVCFLRGVYDKVREGRLEETECNLRQVIRAALDDQDAALRERCERLRRSVDRVAALNFSIAAEIQKGLLPGDLADNLRPRGGM